MKNDNNARTIIRKYVQGAGGHVLDASYFYYETAPNYDKQLAIVCGGYEKCAPDFEINRSNYPYCFIKYTIKGEGSLTIKNKDYEIKPGVITGFGPGVPHHYIADSKNPMEHIFVTFVGKEAKHLLEKSLLSDKGIILLHNPTEVSDIIEKIFKIGSEKRQHSQLICCNYLRILCLLLGQNAEHVENDYSLAMTTFLECKRYIDINFSMITSSAQAAEHCGINPRYMSALFKKCHLSPPHEYIMRLKMNKAANMLLASTLSIKEIAFKIGFEDQYHFSRNFKKFHKLSPRNYRDKHLIAEGLTS
jgi:AraC-like DNA-binding protein